VRVRIDQLPKVFLPGRGREQMSGEKKKADHDFSKVALAPRKNLLKKGKTDMSSGQRGRKILGVRGGGGRSDNRNTALRKEKKKQEKGDR